MIDPARVAREHYGLDAVATALPGELDLNFRLDAGDERYVLKLHEPREDLALEDAVLEHLRDEPAVPRLAGPSRRENGRAVRLLSWLDGRPWAQAAATSPSSGGPSRAWTARCATSSTRRCTARTAGTSAVAALAHLPHQVIHNDANEHNVLVGAGRQRAG